MSNAHFVNRCEREGLGFFDGNSADKKKSINFFFNFFFFLKIRRW